MKRFLLLFLMPALLFCACGKNESAREGSAKEESIKAQGASVKESSVPAIKASADKTKARVGDLISFSLRYYLPEGSSFSENDLGGLEGLSIIAKTPVKGGIDYRILIDKTASFDIGPVSLTFKDIRGELNIIRTDPVHIEVLSNLGDRPAEAELKKIMDIIPVYPLWKRLLPWIAGILLAAAAGAVIYFRRKNRKKKAELQADTRPPHVIAIEELERLKALELIDRGNYKEFYFRFSEILRQYMERIRNFPAAESTTEEITRRIKDEKDRALIPILREADLVKFADSIPSKSRNEDDIKAALEYINATIPEEGTI